MAFDRARAQQNLIRIAKASSGRLRGPVGRATRRFRGEFSGPLVTVVLPVSDDDTTRIGTCLDSLKVQTYRNLEVLVVRFGRHASVGATVRRHADEDWRIKTRLRVEKSLAEARNAGIAAAGGDLVIVAAGGDDFVHAGIERLVEAHLASRSPLVVGAVAIPDIAAWSPDAAYDAAHHTAVRATTLAQSPFAVTDLLLGTKMFTADLWRTAGLRFSEQLPDGTDVALALLHRAPAFDLLTSETYIPTGRRDGVQVGMVPDVLNGLPGWMERTERTWRLVEDLQLPEVLEWWLWGVLGTAVQPLIADVERADDHQWQTLREHIQMLLESADAHVWARLASESRVTLWLLQNDHREALAEYVGERLFSRDGRPTEIRDGRVWALLPHHDNAELGIPPELFEMAPDETRFQASLREARWVDAETLELTVFASIEFVHMDGPPHLECWLEDRENGDRLPLTVRQFRDPLANQAQRRYQDYSWGAFVATVHVADVVAAGTTPRNWALQVSMDVDGVVRSGPVPHFNDQCSAGFIGRNHLAPRPVAGALVGFNPRSDIIGLQLRTDDRPRLTSLAVTGREAVGVLAQQDATDPVRSVRATQGTQQVRGDIITTPEGAEFRLTLPAAWTGRLRWEVRGITAAGREVPLGWPGGAAQWLGIGGGEFVGSRTASGDVEFFEARLAFIVDDVVVDGFSAQVTGRWLAANPPAGVHLELAPAAATKARVTAIPQATDVPGQVRADFELTADVWGLGQRPIEPDWYWLSAVSGDDKVRALLGEDAIDRLHQFMDGTGYSARLVRSERTCGVELLPPTPIADRVHYGRGQLQEWFLHGDIPLDPDAVYFQSYVGASATDSQLALHQELRRTRPDLTLYWGVSSYSSWVPEGGIPVVMMSREWHRVLASSTYLCMNIDPERWFRKRSGQRLLQTFHGYPSKSMGLRMWNAKNYPPRRLEMELGRTSRQWDLILTPTPEMDQYYRAEYAYDGPIHNEGYPRDDILVGDRGEAARADARKRLGIRDDQKAILYAPTWRDDQATNWRAATAVHHLDIAAASRDLGPDYVLLMRGHRFHAAAGAGNARFLDVTDYPEINDLILAADAAVLDYSSLRFDFALTGRPMVFLVPDLDTYVGGVRGFLYDYGPTAPGPHVDTADEVVSLLRDLDGLGRRYADDLAAFHERFSQFQDGHAAERVATAFFGPSVLAPADPVEGKSR